MARTTGTYQTGGTRDEPFRAFVPHLLPPAKPPLVLDGDLERLHRDAVAALGRLAVAGRMVPDAQWFLYGFVRKEALVSSQIEGTQATFQDVVAFEATRRSDRPADVEDTRTQRTQDTHLNSPTTVPPSFNEPMTRAKRNEAA